MPFKSPFTSPRSSLSPKSRPVQATLAVAAVVSAVSLVPLVADAASGHASTTSSAGAGAGSACSSQAHDVHAAQGQVNARIQDLVHAAALPGHTVRQRQHRRAASAGAKHQLTVAQRRLQSAQETLAHCEVEAKPTPTATVTATTTTTTTATATATTTATTTATATQTATQTVTATQTQTATQTVAATPTPAPLVFRAGTARLTETEPDYSAIPPLSYWNQTPIGNTGFGSAFTEDPSNPGYFYGLTDRGPNVTAPDGNSKLEPMLGFQNAIGYFHQVQGTMVLIKTIGLTLPNGQPMNGLVNTEASTGETILDQYGDTLPASKAGLDSEGLVAMPDGSFYVSDEYGPFVVHFDATGKEIARFDPYATGASTSGYFGDQTYPLPAELEKRKANKGMEGLTISPDRKYLFGCMQSSLDANAGKGQTPTSSGNGAIIRIVRINLTDQSVNEYLYALHTNGPKDAAGQAVSECTALPGDDNHLVVDERDGKFEGTSDGTATGTPKAIKALYQVDLTKATDVGPNSPLIGTSTPGGTVTYDAAAGLEVGGKTIEDIAGSQDGSAAVSSLASDTIAVGAESLFLNYAGLIDSIDPSGNYFGHDKVEGVTFDAANPNIVYLANDSDFGITDLPKNTTNKLSGDNQALGASAVKRLPDGTQDFGEVLEVDLSQVPAAYKG